MQPQQQALAVPLKLTARLAQCVQAMLALKNVKRANKQFADWLKIEELRRKIC
jgi:hypothetical protein